MSDWRPISLVVDSAQRFIRHDGMKDAAAIAYYAAFSLPPLLLIAIAIIGFFFEPKSARGNLDVQIRQLAGETAAEQFEEIVKNSHDSKRGFVATLVGTGMLLVGATGVLIQLQSTINRVWSVETKPTAGTWWSIIFKRVLSLGMILVIAFLLLISVAARATISGIGDRMDVLLPPAISSNLLVIVNETVSFVVLSLLFAAMFRFLPDTRIPWRAVWLGAVITAVLFTLGKQIMGFYLSVSNPGTIYGAAGSLAIVLLWVYYASIIVIFGAELTRCWSERAGFVDVPVEFADRV